MAEVLFRAKLQRENGSKKWGFCLQGGADCKRPLVLIQVQEESIAAKGGLMPGDIVVKLGGKSALNMTHKQAQRAIMDSENCLEIIVERAEEKAVPPGSCNDPVTSFQDPDPPLTKPSPPVAEQRAEDSEETKVKEAAIEATPRIQAYEPQKKQEENTKTDEPTTEETYTSATEKPVQNGETEEVPANEKTKAEKVNTSTEETQEEKPTPIIETPKIDKTKTTETPKVENTKTTETSQEVINKPATEKTPVDKTKNTANNAKVPPDNGIKLKGPPKSVKFLEDIPRGRSRHSTPSPVRTRRASPSPTRRSRSASGTRIQLRSRSPVRNNRQEEKRSTLTFRTIPVVLERTADAPVIKESVTMPSTNTSVSVVCAIPVTTTVLNSFADSESHVSDPRYPWRRSRSDTSSPVKGLETEWSIKPELPSKSIPDMSSQPIPNISSRTLPKIPTRTGPDTAGRTVPIIVHHQASKSAPANLMEDRPITDHVNPTLTTEPTHFLIHHPYLPQQYIVVQSSPQEYPSSPTHTLPGFRAPSPIPGQRVPSPVLGQRAPSPNPGQCVPSPTSLQSPPHPPSALHDPSQEYQTFQPVPELVDLPLPAVKDIVHNLNKRLDAFAAQHPQLAKPLTEQELGASFLRKEMAGSPSTSTTDQGIRHPTKTATNPSITSLQHQILRQMQREKMYGITSTLQALQNERRIYGLQTERPLSPLGAQKRVHFADPLEHFRVIEPRLSRGRTRGGAEPRESPTNVSGSHMIHVQQGLHPHSMSPGNAGINVTYQRPQGQPVTLHVPTQAAPPGSQGYTASFAHPGVTLVHKEKQAEAVSLEYTYPPSYADAMYASAQGLKAEENFPASPTSIKQQLAARGGLPPASSLPTSMADLQSRSFKILESKFSEGGNLIEFLKQYEVPQPVASAKPFTPTSPTPTTSASVSTQKGSPITIQAFLGEDRSPQAPQGAAAAISLEEASPGLIALFDRNFTEKFLQWQQQRAAGTPQSETYRLVHEMDSEGKRRDVSDL